MLSEPNRSHYKHFNFLFIWKLKLYNIYVPNIISSSSTAAAAEAAAEVAVAVAGGGGSSSSSIIKG